MILEFAGLIGRVNLSEKPPVAAQSAQPRKLLRFRVMARRALKLIGGLLAIAMLIQIVLLTTPATERLFGWLNVTREPPQEPVDMIVSLGGGYERLVWTALAYR